MLTFIILLILCFPIGVLSYYNSLAFMQMMEYGGIFWKIRHGKFYKYAKLQDKELSWTILNNIKRSEDLEKMIYPEIRDRLQKLYWQVVAYNPPFKLWVCEVCMSHRIGLVYLFSGVVGVYFSGLLPWWGCIALYVWGSTIMSFGITYADK